MGSPRLCLGVLSPCAWLHTSIVGLTRSPTPSNTQQSIPNPHQTNSPSPHNNIARVVISRYPPVHKHVSASFLFKSPSIPNHELCDRGRSLVTMERWSPRSTSQWSSSETLSIPRNVPLSHVVGENGDNVKIIAECTGARVCVNNDAHTVRTGRLSRQSASH
jgi:hypothetical protein